MNLGQIREKVRRKLDELETALWSDDELNDYINQTNRFLWQKMVEAQYRLVQKVDLLSTVENTREVALPSDFYKIRLLEHLVGSVYYPCTYYQRYDTLVGENTAERGNRYRFAYSIIGNNIVLEPTPSSTGTDNLRLTYYYSPVDLVDDSDEPVLESIYHDLYVSGGVVYAKEKEEMIGGGGADGPAFVATFNRQLLQFMNNVGQETQQRQHVQPFYV